MKNVIWDRIRCLYSFLGYLKGLSVSTDEFIEDIGDGYIQFTSQKGTRLIVLDYYGTSDDPETIYLYYYKCTYQDYCSLGGREVPKIFGMTVTSSSLKVAPLLDDKFGAKDIDLALWEVENYLYTKYGTPDQIIIRHENEKKKLMRGEYEV